MYPLYVIYKDDEPYKVIPKITKITVDKETKTRDVKTINPISFVKKISEKFKNVPEQISCKDVGFLTVAGYIMIEILHKINPGICIDSITSLKAKENSISLHQAAVLFATGIKIGRALPKEINFEVESERHIGLR